MREIDLKAFLGAAFGFQDCDSGYGAQQPRSRDMRNFFEGRLGHMLPTEHSIREDRATKTDCINVDEQKAAWMLAEDLENLAAQIRHLLTTGSKRE